MLIRAFSYRLRTVSAFGISKAEQRRAEQIRRIYSVLAKVERPPAAPAANVVRLDAARRRLRCGGAV